MHYRGFTQLSISFLSALFLIIGCKKEKRIPAQPAGPDIYVAGSSFDNNRQMATYWKNGAALVLDSDSTTASDAYAITVNNNIVYVAGVSINTQNGQDVAVQWINGVRTTLITGKGSSAGNAITLSGSDVYVAGSYTPDHGTQIAVYWKNGVLHRLVSDTTN
jgi:hypothetical protein